MTTKTIEIVVSPQGAATVTTKGFAGAICREASKFLEQALGKPGKEQLTTEFHQSAEQQNSLRENA
jgi:hypothetical protein